MSEVGPELLREAYGCLAQLWCSPQDVDVAQLKHRARTLAGALAAADAEAAGLLARFLDCEVSEEEYVSLFELDPCCSLYVGSHVFEEPKTCARAGLSDRNGYMIDLRGIYGHLGLAPRAKELPDYLPLMVEALSLSAGVHDPIRTKLVEEYLLPHLPRIHARLRELAVPYVHLLEALERVLRLDLGTSREVSHV
jgi:nitrate reductase delta subunit